MIAEDTMAEEPPYARWCAAAILVTPDGRYLMQLRDDKPGILLPGHWSLFGGAIEPGEDPAAAVRRELEEELEFAAHGAVRFTDMIIELPMRPPRTDRMTFFTIGVTEAEIAAMIQHEGAGKALFTAEELAIQPRVSPWDLSAILMHARRAALFVDR